MDEFILRSASNPEAKTYNVFKLHKDDNVNWAEAKMRRENEYQPWQIKFGSGRTSRRFKAIKEGGVGDNASYFVFYKPKDSNDTYEVCPIEEWYNVSATQRYKTLTAEEAEQKFEQRHKTLNYFSVMHLKKNGENNDEGVSVQENKSFKVSEMDDWDESGDDEASGDEGNESDDAKKKRRKAKTKKEKEDPDDAPDEGKEESDEGDFEQREVDYMSDSSSEPSDREQEKDETDVRGIAEEEALRDLLSTDDEEDTDNPQQKGSKSGDIKSSMHVSDIKQDPDGNGSDESSDSDDYDVDEEKMDSMFMKKGLPAQLSMVKQEIKPEIEASASNANTKSNLARQPTAANKRKISQEVSTPSSQPVPKRPCPVEPPPPIPSSSSCAAANSPEKVVEDLIRKYLSRKPMTLKTLLKDIKSKLKRMGGVTSEMDNDLVNTIASIIKRLNPDRQKINDITYFSLKA